MIIGLGRGVFCMMCFDVLTWENEGDVWLVIGDIDKERMVDDEDEDAGDSHFIFALLIKKLKQ